MKKFIAIVVAGAFALGGCAESSFSGVTEDTTQNGEITKIIVQYKKKPLTCVILNQNTNFQTMSCDFIEYYNSDNQPLEGEPR